MALLTLLAQARSRLPESRPRQFKVIVFHFDHQWRPESAAEAEKVRNWVLDLGFTFHVYHSSQMLTELELHPPKMRQNDKGTSLLQTPIGDAKPAGPVRLPDYGLEGTARLLRYQALKRLVAETAADFVLTGHTWNDQAETVLMRLARGTGMDGLTGIAGQRLFTDNCQLLRPLLGLKRDQLRTYLTHHQQDFIDDPSNDDQDRTRNRMRHSVLPWLNQNLASHFDQSLIRLAASASENQIAWQHLQNIYASAVQQLQPFCLEIKIRLLNAAPEAVVRQLLVRWWKQTQLPIREMNHSQWVKLAALVVPPRDAQGQIESQWPSEFHFPGPVIAKRSGGILTIKKPTLN